MPAVNRGYSKANDKVSPAAMGTKMVERVINMRKLAPPKMDVKNSPRSNLSGKSSPSPDSSGFGRTLSKKSLDMAIRHMVCICEFRIFLPSVQNKFVMHLLHSVNHYSCIKYCRMLYIITYSLSGCLVFQDYFQVPQLVFVSLHSFLLTIALTFLYFPLNYFNCFSLNRI